MHIPRHPKGHCRLAMLAETQRAAPNGAGGIRHDLTFHLFMLALNGSWEAKDSLKMSLGVGTFRLPRISFCKLSFRIVNFPTFPTRPSQPDAHLPTSEQKVLIPKPEPSGRMRDKNYVQDSAINSSIFSV